MWSLRFAKLNADASHKMNRQVVCLLLLHAISGGKGWQTIWTVESMTSVQARMVA